MHRLKKPLTLFAAEVPSEGSGSGEAGTQSEQKFTQADVDAAVEKIAAKIRAEERRKVSEKFADYDDLKAKAGESTTLEERVAAMEKRAIEAETSALRAKYAADVPERLRPLLTGTSDEELKAQRDLLVEGEAERKKNGNHVPREGETTQPQGDEMREFTRNLFAKAAD
jgi:hypothetical protein